MYLYYRFSSPPYYSSSYFTAFLFGLLGSFHCVGMCGPIAFVGLARADAVAAGKDGDAAVDQFNRDNADDIRTKYGGNKQTDSNGEDSGCFLTTFLFRTFCEEIL